MSESQQAPTIAALGATYHEWIAAHPTTAADFARALDDILSDAGVNFDNITSRVKTWNSLQRKASKRRPDGSLMYPDPWRDIHDLIGARITVLHSTEIPVVLDIIAHSFAVLRSVDKAQETKISGGFGYGSHHLILEVTASSEGLEQYRGMEFEVQVRTVLQHAWAEFEHDVRYKRGANSTAPQVDRAFTLAAGLIELADQQFDQIAALQDPSNVRLPDEELDLTTDTLPGILTMMLGTRFPRSRTEAYRWLQDLLFANGLTTIRDLADLVNEADIEVVRAAMNYRFQPGQVRIIDDLLLNRYGTEHIRRTGNLSRQAKQRPQRLKHRLEQLRLTTNP
ncbi:GTP pyrophosphokinase [Corynebacterium cystitidis]|uniref:GTP pyrophosphokinase n=1 Tax=Corynebacterium cystitidis TaxID=35757 RepID=UPI00211E46C3|nr:GTP pyrophosphokinase family protein [Corynebacterium cystitidis]